MRQVPTGFILRPLERGDFNKGFLSVLSQLTIVGNVSKKEFLELYEYFNDNAGQYFTVVIEDAANGIIVGCCTLFVERKFIHHLGCVGHLEDAVTLTKYRGRHFGRLLIQSLMSVSKNVGCYKVILDCKSSNVAFYEKCGLEKKEVQMVKYFSKDDHLKPKL